MRDLTSKTHPLRALSIGLALAALLAGCATNPATGRRQLSLMTESQEIALGQQADEDITASLGRYDDAELGAYVERLGKSLAARSERPELPWSFKVVDDPVVNAFALPGGFIFVTRGILAHLGSEAELAGVIGHEIGHVTARHSINQMSKAQLATIGLGVGMILRPELEDVGGLAQQGLGLLFLKFGRDDENQADALGVRYMARDNYDPRELAGVFDVLKAVSQQDAGGRVPSWLSTHPDPDSRSEHIRAEVAATGQSFEGATIAADRYLDQIDGIVFGADPREGFFDGAVFKHPGLAFRLEFPADWKTQNQKTAVAAQSPAQDAIVRLALAPQTSAAAAAEAFLGQQGVTAGRSQRTRVNGLEAVAADFGATTQSGELRGVARFIELDGRVFELIGFTPQTQWQSYAGTLERAVTSFDRLTDRRALEVRPQRLEIVKLERAMSLREFVAANPSPVPIEKLALINQLDADAKLRAGTRLKRVTGERLP